jgi:hypothetical protein
MKNEAQRPENLDRTSDFDESRASTALPHGGTTCKRTLRGGRQCRCRPLAGEEFCINHSPTLRGEMERHMRSVAASDRRREAAAMGRDTEEALRRLIAKATRAVSRDDLNAQQLFAINSLLTTAMEMRLRLGSRDREGEADSFIHPVPRPEVAMVEPLQPCGGPYALRLRRPAPDRATFAESLVRMAQIDRAQCEQVCGEAESGKLPPVIDGLDFSQALEAAGMIRRAGGAAEIFDVRDKNDPRGRRVDLAGMSADEFAWRLRDDVVRTRSSGHQRTDSFSRGER